MLDQFGPHRRHESLRSFDGQGMISSVVAEHMSDLVQNDVALVYGAGMRRVDDDVSVAFMDPETAGTAGDLCGLVQVDWSASMLFQPIKKCVEVEGTWDANRLIELANPLITLPVQLTVPHVGRLLRSPFSDNILCGGTRRRETCARMVSEGAHNAIIKRHRGAAITDRGRRRGRIDAACSGDSCAPHTG